MSKRWIVLGVLIVLVPAGIYFLRGLFFEKTSISISKEFTGEAAYNPYFALRELYRGLDASAQTVSGVARLPAKDHVFMLALNDRPLVDSEIEKLLAWAKQGGHLLIPARHKKISGPFLEQAGVDLFDEDVADDDDHLSQSEFRTQRLEWPKLFINDENESTVVRSDGERDAAWAITVKYGQGLLSFPTSLRVLRNDHLAAEQHADLAWWLVSKADGSAPAGVWIAYRQAPISVWALLAARARPVVLALALLCAVALALYARPFGPRLESPPRDRRHLAEHLKATGRYLWDRDVEHALLRAVQDEVQRRLARGGKPTPRQLTVLVRQAAAAHDLDAKQIHQALTLPSTRDPQQFTETIQILEQLRRKA